MIIIIGIGFIVSITSYGIYKILHICKTFNPIEIDCGNQYFRIHIKCHDKSKDKKD